MINLSLGKDPKNVNLGLGCTPTKCVSFLTFLKEYKDIFAWTCSDLKTYYTRIIQYVISMELDEKPYQ